MILDSAEMCCDYESMQTKGFLKHYRQCFFPPVAQQPKSGSDRFIVKVSR
jgi:hypothetical protein